MPSSISHIKMSHYCTPEDKAMIEFYRLRRGVLDLAKLISGALTIAPPLKVLIFKDLRVTENGT